MEKKKKILAIILILLLFLIVMVSNAYLDKSMEKHVEKVSTDCAEKGLGIEAKYNSTGDKYYTCKVG